MSESRPQKFIFFTLTKMTRQGAVPLLVSSFLLVGIFSHHVSAQPWGPWQQRVVPEAGGGRALQTQRSRSTSFGGGPQAKSNQKSLGKRLIQSAHNYAQNELGLEYGQYEIRQTGNRRNPNAAQTKIVVRGGKNKEFTVGGNVGGSGGKAQASQSLTFSNFKTGDVQFVLTGANAGDGQGRGADGLLLRNSGLEQAKTQLGTNVNFGDDNENRNVLLTLDAGGPTGWKAKSYENRSVGNNKFSNQLRNASSLIVAAGPNAAGPGSTPGTDSTPLQAQQRPGAQGTPQTTGTGGGVAGGNETLQVHLSQAQQGLADVRAVMDQVPPEMRQQMQEVLNGADQVIQEAATFVDPIAAP